MKVIIDNIIFAWQKTGGISVVWFELIKRMLNCNNLKEDLLFLNTQGSENNIFFNKLHISKKNIVRNCSKYLFNIKRYLPTYINSNKPFIYHSTYYRVCSSSKAINIITVHDFTYEKFSTGIRKFIHCLSKRYALNKADHIICISENTKRDLLELYPKIQEDKIHIIYNGASDDFFVINDEKRRYSPDSEHFIVYVGSRSNYKNFNLAVEASAISNIKLKIVGGKLNTKEMSYVQSVLGNNFEELGYIENSRLNEIYNKAFALIYPSSYEGFGLPIVEAQKAGCPVLCLNNSSIKEIIGEKEQLVNNADPYSISVQITKLKNPQYREDIIKKGLDNSKRFSWNQTFKQYYELYCNIEKSLF